jgi:hypothetical protein
MAQEMNETIFCQHGGDECFGNLIQNCAASKLAPHEADEFIICMEGNLKRGMQCMDQASYSGCVSDESSIAALETCAKGEEGMKLMLAAGKKTTTVAHANMAPFVTVGDDPALALYNIKGAQFRKSICSNAALAGCCTQEYNVDIIDQRRLTLV